MVWAAIFAASLSLMATTLVGYVTWRRGEVSERVKNLEVALADREEELNQCTKDRLMLRQNMQLIVSSIIGLLPQSDQFRLLSKMDEALRPVDADIRG